MDSLYGGQPSIGTLARRYRDVDASVRGAGELGSSVLVAGWTVTDYAPGVGPLGSGIYQPAVTSVGAIVGQR
jgi:hypothetical protein